ncbi:uncharacterized protein LOC143276271 isoform X2 [Babylonia areolata]|uniref:uncharacterized protein LOC143276271 isoform X2 n=1 Tax=Babylonia areolata TaxID=304850 RepID=UPI003FCF1DEE
MTSLLALLLAVTLTNCVTAQGDQELCATAKAVNTSSVACTTDADCSTTQICCSLKGSMQCSEPAVPNFHATLYVVGVVGVVTSTQVKDAVLERMGSTGTGWQAMNKTIGGCMGIYLEGVVEEEEEEEVSVKLDQIEEEGLTVASIGHAFRVSSREDEVVDVCRNMSISEEGGCGSEGCGRGTCVPSTTGGQCACPEGFQGDHCQEPVSAVPNFETQLYIVGVVGAVTPAQVKDALLRDIGSVGTGWQFLNRTIGGCMAVHLEAVVRREEEEGVSVNLDNLEERGLVVTSSKPAFNVTSRKDEVLEECQSMTLPNETNFQVHVTLEAKWEDRYANVNLPVMQDLAKQLEPAFENLDGFRRLKIVEAMPGSVRVTVEPTVSKNVSLSDVQEAMVSTQEMEIEFDGEIRDVSNISLATDGGCGQRGCGNGTCVESSSGPRCLCPKGAHGDTCQEQGQ